MRLYDLTFRAIGPFPGEHHIDFTELGASGLFLLEGPTGSGKSTIIDAIVYALYGSVAGAGNSSLNERLRSHHAPGDVSSFIELVFETGHGIFRVRRSPEYQRPKKRGTGTTLEQTQIRLWKLSGPDDQVGEVLSTATREADAELLRIVALTREQFEQTVVLPQGEFARFLRTKPDDRRQLLQRLFGTEIFEQLQDELAAMRKEMTNRLKDDTAKVTGQVNTLLAVTEPEDHLAARLLGAVGLADPESNPESVPANVTRMPASQRPIDAAALRAALTDLDHALTQQLTNAESEHSQLADRFKEAVHDREARAATHARLEELESLRAQQEILTDDEPAQRVRQLRLAQSGPAAVINAHLQSRDAALQRVEAARSEFRSTMETAREYGLHGEAIGLPPLDGGASEHEDSTNSADQRTWLTQSRDSDLARVGELDHLVELERSVPELQRTLTQLEKLVVETAAGFAQLTKRWEQLPALRVELVGELESARVLAATKPRAEASLAAAQEVRHAVLDSHAVARDLAAVELTLAQASRDANEANDREHALRQWVIAGMAGTLAADLVPGKPCAVCGALEHPAPAPTMGDTPTPDDLAESEADRLQCFEKLTQAEASRATLAAELARVQLATRGQDLEQAEAATATAEQILVLACDAEHSVEGHAQALTDLDAEALRVGAQRNDQERQIAEARVEVDRHRTELAGVDTKVAAARGSDSSVAANQHRLIRRAEIAAEVIRGLDQIQELTAAANSQEEHLAKALADSAFEDLATATQALLAEPERGRLEELSAKWNASDAVIAARLSDPQWETPEGAAEKSLIHDRLALAKRIQNEHANLALAVSAEQESQAALNETLSIARTKQHGLRRCRELTVEMTASLHRLDQALTESTAVFKMANLVTAADGVAEKRITLGTFVLMRRFGDVVDAANERLTVMSDGRYELIRIEEVEKGQRARRAGLGLQVVDHTTGQARDPKTLSGGETFYVSLCLALGLADIVVAEAGGVDLGTLFVDEGFGSLDSETLDAVLGELSKLRAGGRLVGIVSHVEELKQRIGERVEVRRGRDGTSTVTVRG